MVRSQPFNAKRLPEKNKLHILTFPCSLWMMEPLPPQPMSLHHVPWLESRLLPEKIKSAASGWCQGRGQRWGY